MYEFGKVNIFQFEIYFIFHFKIASEYTVTSLFLTIYKFASDPKNRQAPSRLHPPPFPPKYQNTTPVSLWQLVW